MANMFTIHNKVRGRDNRTQRAAAPVHHRLVPRIGDEQLRLRRGRPLQVSADFLTRNFAALKEQHGQGIIEVRTPEGNAIALDQISQEDVDQRLARLPTELRLPPPPLPNFPLDDARKDTPAGYAIPIEPGYDLDETGGRLDPNAKPALLDLAPKENPPAQIEEIPPPPADPDTAALEAALQAASEEGEPIEEEGEEDEGDAFDLEPEGGSEVVESTNPPSPPQPGKKGKKGKKKG